MPELIRMRDWLEPLAVEAPRELAQELGLSGWLAGIFARRGLVDLELARGFLDPQAYVPAPPNELPGLDDAVDRLRYAIRQGERILVWGDFDVDGQTATALFVEGLRDLGGVVDYHIPIRAEESHGVTLPALHRILDGASPPRVVLTCDTGITAFEAAEYVSAKGVDFVITDHHELARDADGDSCLLPGAKWIVTPRFLPNSHPLASLPGVGVAFKVVEALYGLAGRAEVARKHLDLVALGIVADVAYQMGDTRYLLQLGLELMRSQPRQGLLAIYERAELNPQGLNEDHIGFVIAPRLNALGRLGDANPAVELLTTNDRGRARLIALQLEGLNARRRLLTNQIFRGALAQLEQNRDLINEPALVLVNPSWEAGVIGIVASRLVELYGKPVVMISAPPGGPGRGSARSVDGVDITRAIASQHKLLLGYGGHAMAAGLSIQPENIPAFRRGLNQAVGQTVIALQQKPLTHQIDAELPWGDVTLELANEIELLAPFGPGNPALTVVSRGLHLVSHAALGREKEHLLLTVEDANGLSRQVFWWGGANYLDAYDLPQGQFELAYHIRGRTYRGDNKLQLDFVDFRIVSEETRITEYHPILVDYRLEPHPLRVLAQLFSQPPHSEILVWAEGKAAETLSNFIPQGVIRGRLELYSPIKALVIWTAPPSTAVLKAVIQQVQPVKVILFAVEPEESDLQVFTSRLAGLVRYVMARQGGITKVSSLSVATAQCELTVLRGLEWLAAEGHFSLLVEGDNVHLSPGNQADERVARLLLEQLHNLLNETRAYRSFFRRAIDLLE